MRLINILFARIFAQYNIGGRLIDFRYSWRPDTSTRTTLDFLRKAKDADLCIIMIPPENNS